PHGLPRARLGEDANRAGRARGRGRTPGETVQIAALLHGSHAVTGEPAGWDEADGRVRQTHRLTLPGRRRIAAFAIAVAEEDAPIQEGTVADHLFTRQLGRARGRGLPACPGLTERRGTPPPDERCPDLEPFDRLDCQSPWDIWHEPAGTAIERRQVNSPLPPAGTLDDRASSVPRDTDIDVVQQQPGRRCSHDSGIELQRDTLEMLTGIARAREERPPGPLLPLV